MSLMQFDRLYIVSDLHLGGDGQFQIFNQGKCLANTVNQLTANPNQCTGLVLNGDIVDFLAEKPAKYLDPLGAIDKLKRITNDAAFKKSWQALREYTGHDHCHLIVVLGNHDVELALPEVRQWLLENLAVDEQARGRVQLHLDGTGFTCLVGDKRVLCMHGNEVDNWNVVDHLALIQLGRALNRTMEPPEWDANAGTRLVISVMNRIKKDYPMVDLLKPEVEGVLPTIVALKPDIENLHIMAKLTRVMGQLTKDKIRRSAGFLAAEEELMSDSPQEGAPFAELERILADGNPVSERGDDYRSQLLLTAYEQAGLDDYEMDDLAAGEMLGIGDWWKKHVGSLTREELLRKALQCLIADSPAFNLDHQDETFKELDESVGGGVDYLVAGHTHLRRALPRRNGFYYNSGTWIRLIRLTREVLNDKSAFAGLWEAFNAGSMEALDKHRIPGPEVSRIWCCCSPRWWRLVMKMVRCLAGSVRRRPRVDST